MDCNVIDYYSIYDEDGRLFRDFSHQIEWLTTMYYFDKMIPPHSKIFDGCAGTGNYAFPLAERGHKVVASDIVPRNVEIMLEKQKNKPILEDIFVGDICQENQYENQSFDVVLCMGAFYHLEKNDCRRALEQCLRLMKNNGILVITYINLMAALQLKFSPKLENMDEILKCYESRSFGDAFIYMTPEEMEKIAYDYRLKILHHLSSDGNTFMRIPNFNMASKENFDKYMHLHLSTCEDKYLLGYGLHGLVFLTKS